MAKELYKIHVLNFQKHNSTLKKGHKATLISNNFCSDSKLGVLPLTVRWMFLGIILTCGDYTSDTVEMNERQLRELLESSWSVQRALDALKQIQVLTYEKIELFINRIEKKEKEENRKETESNRVQKPKATASENPADLSAQKTKNFISKYCSLFKTKYGTNPQIMGKESGIAKRLAKDLSEEKAGLYLEAFFAMPDSLLVKNKHPLAQFEYKLNEITVFAESGKFTTYKQAIQAQDSVSYAKDQMRRLINPEEAK